LNLATFGLAVGAATAPVYNAYKDLTTALALGAGATYAANTLFFPVDQAQLYAAAVGALSCVHQRGEGLLVALSPEGSAAALQTQFDTMLTAVPGVCRSSPAAKPVFDEFETAFNRAYVSMSRVESSDFAAGIKLHRAGQNVVLALNQEIDNRAPSAAAVLAAAKSLSALTTTTVAPAAKQAIPRGFEDPTSRALVCPDQVIAQMKTQTDFYRRRQQALDNALDALDALDQSCVFNAPVVAALSVSQESVVLVPNSSVSLVVSGGRPPYSFTWDTTPPNTSIVLQRPVPEIFIVEGVSTLKDGSYRLTIRDSGVSARSKTVQVTAKTQT
jgi:hypothetical protein